MACDGTQVHAAIPRHGPHCAWRCKTRIGNLEQQLANERGKSQQNALAEAREELASARAVTRRLQQRLAEDKQSVQAFSRQFGEYQTMQEELRGLDQMRMAARQRLLALEASELARKPRIKVVEAATTPQTAWRPLYWRDAGISLAGSLALAFLAVWFVEFFDRSEPIACRAIDASSFRSHGFTVGRPDLLAVGGSDGAGASPRGRSARAGAGCARSPGS